MKSLVSTVIVMIILAWRTSADFHYVKPDNYSMPCQQCLTLDEYAQQADKYFTTGSTFLFLLGNHTLWTTVNLTNVSDVEFRGMGTDVTIIHGNNSIISCWKVNNLTIDGLTLKTTIIRVLRSKNILIKNSTFLGSSLSCNYSLIYCLIIGKSMRGGAINAAHTDLTIINSNFIGNYAFSGGGSIYIASGDLNLINSNFMSGGAYFGGAIYAKLSNVTMDSNSSHNGQVIFSENRSQRGGALFLDRTIAVFKETVVIFQHNSAGLGGGIFSIKSSLNFTRTSTNLFIGNNASGDGGAIWLGFTKMALSRYTNTSFINNKARSDGGALYGSNAKMEFNGSVTFSNNSAERGGGMFLLSVTLKFARGMNLTTSYNNASKYGGAIYYEDALTLFQCNVYKIYESYVLPYCFIQTIGTDLEVIDDTSMGIYSYYNSAGRYGSFLYGGALDRCQLKSTNTSSAVKYSTSFSLEHIIKYIQPNSNGINLITSQPYTLCFCGENCKYKRAIAINTTIYRGQRFNVSLYTIAQGGTSVSTTVTARTSVTANLKSNQTSQTLSENCSILTYNLHSAENNEELVLHPDGLCSDKGNITVKVRFKDCPPGFGLSKDECICDKRLMQYNLTCIIDEDILIMRYGGSRLWVNASYENGTYRGLILYKACPVEYCKTETINISLDKPDTQCALNRSGVLCGACVTNHSLMLGSSRCHVCPNTYLTLLLPFAAAGVALVIFLSISRLTVATGMINSVILYANIVQVNRQLFFSKSKYGILLTVFIAWMNLDLGIETCFYNGMTAHVQTWLQFAFPIYIWILIILIIITSRYSVAVSKLIGHNPIAVLATLLLMSYTKILKIIIDVYSSAKLEYTSDTVWLKDGNVPYLQSWHLLLTVVTSLILVFLFLPYTLLLLLGYKLYRFSGRKHMRWLNRLKPLLDSYYAPYKKHTRCWTGFLLLVRSALYIVFSFEDANRNLLTIAITFGIIVLAFTLLPGRIYTSSYTNIIESLVYSNLVLSTIILALGPDTKSRLSTALVYSLVGMVFVIMMGIIVYHIHILYTAHSFGLGIQAKISEVIHQVNIAKKDGVQISENTSKEVSTTVIELREPLLET